MSEQYFGLCDGDWQAHEDRPAAALVCRVVLAAP